jgi:hypothetical protein
MLPDEQAWCFRPGKGLGERVRLECSFEMLIDSPLISRQVSFCSCRRAILSEDRHQIMSTLMLTSSAKEVED